jgi:hypothetical protein
MSDQPKWKVNAEEASMQAWVEYLLKEAKRLFAQDKTHANLLFCFTKENGLVSINPIPPNIDHEQLDIAFVNAVKEHNLYGIVFIGETWMYFIKEKKDHTAFQILDGEMKVADLNDEDKKEALMIRMENRDGDSLTYLNEIKRDESGVALKEGKVIKSTQKRWFTKTLC